MNNKKSKTDILAIDAILPQTQCGLCEYSGCLPYAKAIVEDNIAINRCLPGGVTTLRQLGELLNQDITPYLAEMQKKAKPAVTAIIQEKACIGCTKCIQACPVDAIIGASKQMHTIISDACTGCELCVPPCPVDCIDIIPIAERNAQENTTLANQSRLRYQKRQDRLRRLQKERRSKHQTAKLTHTVKSTTAARQTAIQEAIARVRAKKLSSIKDK